MMNDYKFMVKKIMKLYNLFNYYEVGTAHAMTVRVLWY